MTGDRERLRYVLESIERILVKTGNDGNAFLSDESLQFDVLHDLQLIGEAAHGLSEEFRERHRDKVWSSAADMRHMVVPHCCEIDAENLWSLVEHDLATLRQKAIDVLVET